MKKGKKKKKVKVTVDKGGTKTEVSGEGMQEIFNKMKSAVLGSVFQMGPELWVGAALASLAGGRSASEAAANADKFMLELKTRSEGSGGEEGEEGDAEDAEDDDDSDEEEEGDDEDDDSDEDEEDGEDEEDAEEEDEEDDEEEEEEEEAEPTPPPTATAPKVEVIRRPPPRTAPRNPD